MLAISYELRALLLVSVSFVVVIVHNSQRFSRTLVALLLVSFVVIIVHANSLLSAVLE
jgi:hypothetical protein